MYMNGRFLIMCIESIYPIFDQDERRVQYGESECEAWTHCERHRVGVDMGGNVAAVEYCGLYVWCCWTFLGK
jgi:hypothetical protein